MTEPEYNQALGQGQVTELAPPETTPAENSAIPDIKDYEAVLRRLRSPRTFLPSLPTTTPKTFVDSIEYVDDGIKRPVFFINGEWVDTLDIIDSRLPLTNVVTYDNSLYLGNMAAGANTIAFTCAGLHRVLVVAVNNNANDASPTSVTYNGVALTELNHASGASNRLSYWYLLSPELSTHNIVVTMPGTDTGTAGAVSVSNSISQIVRNGVAVSAAGADPGITVLSAINSLIVDAVYDDHVNAHAPGAGQSKVAAGTNFVGMSYKDAAAPSTGMTFAGATAGIMYHVGAEIVA
jgi:hypothetical protein